MVKENTAGVLAGAAARNPVTKRRPAMKQTTARGPGRDPREVFRILDSDNDGKVTRVEFRFHKTEVSYQRDTNRDGYLTNDEIPGINPTVFAAADTDRDDRLSGYEFLVAEFVNFGAMDANADGIITLDEFLAYARRLQ